MSLNQFMQITLTPAMQGRLRRVLGRYGMHKMYTKNHILTLTMEQFDQFMDDCEQLDILQMKEVHEASEVCTDLRDQVKVQEENEEAVSINNKVLGAMPEGPLKELLQGLMKDGQLRIVELEKVDQEEVDDATKSIMALVFDTFYLNNVSDDSVAAWQHLVVNGGVTCSHISLQPAFKDTSVFDVWERANTLYQNLLLMKQM